MAIPIFGQEHRLVAERELVPEVLRREIKEDAASGDKWQFIYWGNTIIRVEPPGAPAGHAIPLSFAVTQRELKMPLRLPLIEEDFWDPRGNQQDGRVLTSDIEYPGGIFMASSPQVNHLQVSTPGGRRCFSTGRYLQGLSQSRRRFVQPEASDGENSDHEMHPGARNMTKKERRRHRKMNDNFFKPRAGGMAGPPTLKALLDRDTDTWNTANPFQVS